MPKEKTIILPPDNSKAVKIFKELIVNQPFAILVVFGDETDEDISNLVSLSDSLAGGNSISSWRRVVWVQNRNQLPDLIGISELDSGNIKMLKNEHVDEIVAFFITLHDSIGDIIFREELPVKRGRIIRGFFDAEGN